MRERPELSTINLSRERYDELSRRLSENSLSAEDRVLLGGILKAMLWLTGQLEAGRLGLARLKNLIFGPRTESRRNLFGGKPRDNQASHCGSAPADCTEESNEAKRNLGHGGRPASSEYTGAKRIFCSHIKLKSGDLCPECELGRLHSSIENGIFVRFTGSPPLTATLYETERLRCATCGKVFEAELPEGVPPYRYDETARTMAALLRYGYGLPHYRLEKLQKELGHPISDASLFECAEHVADCGNKPYEELVSAAAQGEQINLDDTRCKILDLIKENKETTPDRTGIFTSAVISRVEDHEIVLFKSGRKHMGENLEELLGKRNPGQSRPRLMIDGSNVVPKELEVILGNCLTHARRNFVDIRKSFPSEIEHVIDLFAEIYRHDAITKERAMSDEHRLRYHQENSAPVIESLKSWCHDQIATRKTEPNSGLGKAIRYMEKRWHELTLFLRVPGAPLSNDAVERIIKRCVLHRKNSLFYKSLHGAAIGDILMTLIQTTVQAGKDPFDYLTRLQHHRSEAHKNPKAWLPWNYEAALAALTQKP